MKKLQLFFKKEIGHLAKEFLLASKLILVNLVKAIQILKL